MKAFHPRHIYAVIAIMEDEYLRFDQLFRKTRNSLLCYYQKNSGTEKLAVLKMFSQQESETVSEKKSHQTDNTPFEGSLLIENRIMQRTLLHFSGQGNEAFCEKLIHAVKKIFYPLTSVMRREILAAQLIDTAAAKGILSHTKELLTAGSQNPAGLPVSQPPVDLLKQLDTLIKDYIGGIHTFQSSHTLPDVSRQRKGRDYLARMLYGIPEGHLYEAINAHEEEYKKINASYHFLKQTIHKYLRAEHNEKKTVIALSKKYHNAILDDIEQNTDNYLHDLDERTEKIIQNKLLEKIKRRIPEKNAIKYTERLLKWSGILFVLQKKSATFQFMLLQTAESAAAAGLFAYWYRFLCIIALRYQSAQDMQNKIKTGFSFLKEHYYDVLTPALQKTARMYRVFSAAG